MSAGTGSAGEEAGLVSDSWPSGARAAGASSLGFRRNGCREDEGGGIIAGEPYDCGYSGQQLELV